MKTPFADGRVTLAVLLAGAAERDALVEGYVVADDRSFTDDHAHAVIDEEAAADLRAGMNLDAGKEARPTCDKQRARKRQPCIQSQ